jgi:hypothetical protein
MPLAFAGAMNAAADQGASIREHPAARAAAVRATAAPSRFDYVVLASVAASQRPLSLAAYRPQPAPRD